MSAAPMRTGVTVPVQPSGTVAAACGGAVLCAGQLTAESNTFAQNVAQSHTAANYYAYGVSL